MENDSVIKSKDIAELKKEDMPRTFLSKAYLTEIEKGTYGLYRDLLVEVIDTKTGQTVREKHGPPIGPISMLREMRPGEEEAVVLRSYDAKKDRLLELVEAR